jgi:DedD protein
VEGPRTHYQISLTARQAMGVFVGLLVALAVAFFFGLMAGVSGRASADDSGPAAAVAVRQPTPEPPPAAEKAAPAAGAGFEAPSRTVLAGQPASPRGPEEEPSPPPVLQSFDDGGAAPAPVASVPAPAAAPKSAGARAPDVNRGSVWVQVASLSSSAEANTLRGRLGRHGFPARVLPAEGPKGKIYRVRVGPYSSEEEAGKAAARLSKQEKIREPWVVPEGK